MNCLLFITQVLQKLEEFSALLRALERGESPAVLSGLSAVHRAHAAAQAHLSTGRPVLLICADEAEAGRMAADLGAFTGKEVLHIPARELILRDAATVSRQWEHRRLEVLSRIVRGSVPVMVATAEALFQRTIPPETLSSTALTLRQDESHDLDALLARLSAAGYSRCEQVEGPGQFAARGGILDVYSPSEDRPVRIEFFGDQIDAMGIFDPDSQRRTENVGQVSLLPAAEALPDLAPGGRTGLVAAISALRQRIQKRQGAGAAQLLSTLDHDLERIEASISFPAADRYLSLIYPAFATALDYLPEDTLLFFSESSGLPNARGAFSGGTGGPGDLCGGRTAGRGTLRPLAGLGRVLLPPGRPSGRLSGLLSRLLYPLPPRLLLALSCKQLPAYGGSLETAAEDLKSYAQSAFGVVVLCPPSGAPAACTRCSGNAA